MYIYIYILYDNIGNSSNLSDLPVDVVVSDLLKDQFHLTDYSRLFKDKKVPYEPVSLSDQI